MKNIYLLFIVFVFPVAGFSQTVPTVSEIYNFAVGDTFEYQGGSSNGSGGYFLEVILARQDYGNDSIVYAEKYFGVTGASSDSAVLSNNISDLDSGYYFLWLGPGIYPDSTTLIISNSDTTYQCGAHSPEPYILCGDGNYYTANISSTGEFKMGLGATNTMYNIYTAGCMMAGFTSLAYCHKKNGIIYGTPLDFITSINGLSDNNAIQLFPNPATNNFQLQFTEPPPDKTYLQIFNGLGQEVMDRQISSSSTSINRGKLSNGIYFWQVIQSDDVLQRGKLILQ